MKSELQAETKIEMERRKSEITAKHVAISEVLAETKAELERVVKMVTQKEPPFSERLDALTRQL